jgi:hypothetical protein
MMGISLLEGREFTGADPTNQPNVAIISRTFAADYFSGRSPLGQRFHFIDGSPNTDVADEWQIPESGLFLCYGGALLRLRDERIKTRISVQRFKIRISNNTHQSGAG